MEDMFLIYINYIGIDYKGKFIYEFLFSDTIKDIDGQDWDAFPASGRPSPPHNNFIKKVGRLESDIKFELIQDSSLLSVWDSVDGVIALGYENIDNYESYPTTRLHFHFGIKLNVVEASLYVRDTTLEYK